MSPRKKKKTVRVTQSEATLFPLITPFGERFARVPALYAIWGQAGRGKTSFALMSVYATYRAMQQTQQWLQGEIEAPPVALVPPTQFIFATLGAERAPMSPNSDVEAHFKSLIIQASDGTPPTPSAVVAAIREEIDPNIPGLFLVIDGVSAGRYKDKTVGARALWQEDLLNGLSPLLYKKFNPPSTFDKAEASYEDYKRDRLFGGKENFIGGFVVVILLAQARASVDATMRQVAPALAYSLRHAVTLIYAKGGQQGFVFSPQAGEATKDARIPIVNPETVYNVSSEVLDKTVFGFTVGRVANIKYTVEVVE